MNSATRIGIVSGAGTGIGRAVALAWLREGHSVVLAGRRAESLEETAAMREASGSPGEAHVVATDVSQPDSVRALFQKTEEKFGRLDLLFNNAGINVPATALEDLTFEQWKSVIDINLTGTFLCTQEALRLMKSQRPGGGRIINNGSISASVPRPFAAAYTASKHAVSGLTKSTALEGRNYDIACGQIDIGNADTAMVTGTKKGTLQANGETAVEAVIDVDCVARAVLYMSNLPLDANVLFMTVMATKMPFVGRG